MRFTARRVALLLFAIAGAGCAAVPAATAPAASARYDFGLRGALTQGGLVIGAVPAGTTLVKLDGKPLDLAPDGRFLIGFGRDHGPSATIEAQLDSGALLRSDISIAPRRWDIQSLPTLRRGTAPTPEFLRRRPVELQQIEAARNVQSDTQGWRQRFIWPATGPISGVFGSQRIYAGEPGAPHGGVDVAQPSGTPIVAPADGVVVLAAAEPFTLEGHLLIIDHGMGLNSAMLHLSRIDVKPGEAVSRGQTIGAIGASGRTTGPHLHWGMKWRDERVDPQLLAGPMPR